MSGSFGSFASASGYGHTQGGYGSKEIECNSALGLIGLLGLIELLRDVIENMVEMPDEGGAGTRRRRSVHGGGIFRNSFVGSLFRDNIPSYHPLGPLPALLLPLLHSAVDASDGFHPPSCFERTLCDTNRALAAEGTSWGIAGTYVTNSTSSLISNVIAKAFTNDEEGYVRAVKAGEFGRAGGSCENAYSSCDLSQEYHVVPVNVVNVVKQHLSGMT